MIGSSYIIYLGISMLLSKKPELSNLDKHKSSYKNSILIGLVTNIFNVKAFLFFISLFTILIDTIDGLYFYIYPLYFAVTSSLWFILVSYILTVSNNKNFNLYANKYISLIMSFVLCFIGLLILIRSIYEYF